jgi:hypothetical protein
MKRLIMALGLAGPVWAATISGQILDSRERPIYGARVDVSAVAGSAAFKPFQASKLTLRDGTFTFTVNAGSYRICASVRKNVVLNPCVWSKTPPQATVTQNQTLVMKPLVLARGYPLTVQLNDTGTVLAQAAANRTGNTVVVGITAANGMFHPMPVRQTNATLREHVAMVPRDTPVQVSVVNRGFAMTDASGKAVPSGAAPYQFSAVIAGEKKPRVFAFSVSGLQKAGN